MHQAKSSTTLSVFLSPLAETLCATRTHEPHAQILAFFALCCAAQLVARETTAVRNFPKPPEIKGFEADTGFRVNVSRKDGVDKPRAVA
jgi:hypothetical protein